ncbi:glutamyl-trna amidotransferase subunit c [Nannochloropsis gaditana]|uniref:Glutamyl-trna amidotransferase subunit c n=2 Tax=Nannochloropsis gaditana TaxID=72520 RepID=W7TR28_9STRA|nr:glutamyl-trna amidotransferase subunit c [Nannochloropsis gaditana]
MRDKALTSTLILQALLKGSAFLLPLAPSLPSSRLAAADSPSSSSLRQQPEVTPELIKHTATLAQLHFDEDEIQNMIPRFQAFLSFVDRMQDVPDSAAVSAPDSMPTVQEVLRPDSPSIFPNQDAIFTNMAEQEDAFLRVPKVGEEDT